MQNKNKFYKSNRLGITVMTAPFVLIISMVFLTILTVYIVNIIIPFIWYQKLQLIATKYMYVIEKYGYLTSAEKDLLYSELSKEGFEIENIVIDFPEKKLDYGTMFNFDIIYEYTQFLPTIENKQIHEAKKILLHVKKYSYSKI